NNWGFIHADFTKETTYELTKQFYAMAHFSRFIRPGNDIIITPDNQAIAAFDQEHNRLILVAHNNGKIKKDLQFNLQKFQYSTTCAQIYETTEEINLEQSDIKINDSFINVELAPISIKTIVIEQIELW